MNFIARRTFFDLQNHLEKPEISIVLGPRQAGKTTMLEKLQDELKKNGKPTVFLNLDIVEDRQFFTSQHTLLDYVNHKLGKTPAFVFIDEISRLKNAGLFLKGLYDLRSSHKFIVTGSGSLELKADILEPLTGRKQIFYCFPLSFTEYAAYKLEAPGKTFEELFRHTTRLLNIQPLKRSRIVRDYLHFGGYPRVALAESENEKIAVLREIYSSYLEKDISLLLKVEKTQAFGNLIRILASQAGNLINRTELSSSLGLDIKTIDSYLNLLEKTFVIQILRPFYRNIRTELVKSPKVYFNDLGFLSIAQGIVPSQEQPITGHLFENACLLKLIELDLLNPPRFWRTKSAAEVDFVIISEKTAKPIPIEVKTKVKKSLGKSLISFIDKYEPDEGYFYTLEETLEHRKYKNTTIYTVPYHYLPRREV